jgi:hypothetical protein
MLQLLNCELVTIGHVTGGTTQVEAAQLQAPAMHWMAWPDGQLPHGGGVLEHEEHAP